MFGRVPYEWVGRRIALFATEWGGEPCIRIWGSPDIERDIEVLIELPRKRPFPMTMHAMGSPRYSYCPMNWKKSRSCHSKR